jgi:hypothetical protein
MYTNILAAIIITIIVGILFLIYYLQNFLFSFQMIPKDVLIILFLILQIISLFFLYYTPYNTNPEQFYFEVSPERKKCLMEQVSLDVKPGFRSKNCCPTYTVGGKLPAISQWENSESPIHWDRNDNNTTSAENNAYSTQLAPTALHQKELSTNATPFSSRPV